LKTSLVLPLRWMAPELFATQRATSKSDVYAYGVLTNEVQTGARWLCLPFSLGLVSPHGHPPHPVQVFSRGETPFGHLSDAQVVAILQRAALQDPAEGISKPEGDGPVVMRMDPRVPGAVAAVLQACLMRDPTARPSFVDLALLTCAENADQLLASQMRAVLLSHSLAEAYAADLDLEESYL
jgi:serine/threonine protein kinase